MDTVLLQTHILSSLLHLFDLFILLLSLSLETHIFLQKLNPTFHLIPLAFILLLPSKFHSKQQPLYLLDFSCLKPHPSLRVPTSFFTEHLSLINRFPSDSISFMTKLITSADLSQETYFPPPLHLIPPSTALRDSIQETHFLLFPALDDLFSKTHLSPADIDVLVTNCSGFCPSPSLSSIIVNRYSMRDDVKTFSVSGMGCSAGAIAVDIAASVLRGGYAVVISTEILSTGWYAGRDHRKLLLNCFFRTGCSAVLLTNRKEARKTAKYRLVHLLRTQRASDDRAYHSAIREEDSEGITGFSIERDIILRVAAETLRLNLRMLGARVLPLHEKVRYGLGICAVPDFKRGIEHYCMPASGRGVIEEIGKGLGLGREEMEAALMTFRRFGNQSSATVWYQLAYLEGKGRVGKGERVLQLGMGSGPKCNAVVWESLGRVEREEVGKGPWCDCIHRYPPVVGSGGGRKIKL